MKRSSSTAFMSDANRVAEFCGKYWEMFDGKIPTESLLDTKEEVTRMPSMASTRVMMVTDHGCIVFDEVEELLNTDWEGLTGRKRVGDNDAYTKVHGHAKLLYKFVNVNDTQPLEIPISLFR